MQNKLLILGAGQYGLLVREIAISMNCFSKIDFLDDIATVAIGKISDYEVFSKSYSHAVVAIGDPNLREELFLNLKSTLLVLTSIISPLAYVSNSATIGAGVVVEPMAVIQSGVVVGDGVIVSSGAVLRHNSVVENFCHCDCNSVISSNSVVSKGFKVEKLTLFR